MTAPDSNESPVFSPGNTEANLTVKPSWKPLFWLVAGLGVLIGLGEVFFDFILEGIEFLADGIFYAVEGSEELLEDKIEEWFDLDPYHAEIVTAWSLTPLKLLLALLVLRWLWGLVRRKFLPKASTYCKRQFMAVRLAWRELGWPYKLLMGLVLVGALFILI